MRIIGDNSDGFRNEIQIEKALDFRLYEEVNPNLRHFLDDVFKGYDIRHKRIHAIRCRINVKPDFYLTIDGIPKQVYVSIKKGSGNSIHQESLVSFVKFLSSVNVPSKIVDYLKMYHFSDGTTDNTGTHRVSAKQFEKQHPNIVSELDKAFLDKRLQNLFFERFLFRGNIDHAPVAEYVYHGTVHAGVWASRDEILRYYSNYEPTGSGVHLGPFTYQAWNKNLDRKPEMEKRRLQMQVKWGSLEKALLEITSRREQYRQNGTYEGEMNEKSCVILFNRDPENDAFSSYLKAIQKDSEKILLIRVTTKQFSKLSNQKVMTRADAYAIEVLDDRLFDVLELNGFYLDEDIIADYTEYYQLIACSGLSIKLDDSKSYQLLKLTPNSFNQMFGNYELGFGASVFCQNADELPKNMALLSGWHTSIDKVRQSFGIPALTEQSLTTSIDLCKSIKKYSIERITMLVTGNRELQLMIFNGIGLYEEPYTAWYFMQNRKIIRLTVIPFAVTTGSGRSHGDYTIVFKPR